MHEDWAEYVQRVVRGASRKDIADAAGVDPSNVSRWVAGKRPSADKAIAFAKALGKDPVEALVAAGYLSPRDAGATEVAYSMKSVASEALIHELSRRLGDSYQNAESVLTLPSGDGSVLSGGKPGRGDIQPRTDRPPI